VDVAAAGIVQVREVELVHLFLAHQVEQRFEVVRVERRHGVAQPDLDAARAQQAQSREAALERAALAAELVVRLAQAVEADAHVVEALRGDAVGQCVVYQRPVAREADVKAHVLGARGNVEQVGAHQRLAAREDEHWHVKGLEIVHDGKYLVA